MERRGSGNFTITSRVIRASATQARSSWSLMKFSSPHATAPELGDGVVDAFLDLSLQGWDVRCLLELIKSAA